MGTSIKRFMDEIDSLTVEKNYSSYIIKFNIENNRIVKCEGRNYFEVVTRKLVNDSEEDTKKYFTEVLNNNLKIHLHHYLDVFCNSCKYWKIEGTDFKIYINNRVKKLISLGIRQDLILINRSRSRLIKIKNIKKICNSHQ